MARNYQVLKSNNVNWMFLDPNSHHPEGYISYRHVLSYALQSSLKNHGTTAEQVVPLLSHLKDHWDKGISYRNGAFIDIEVNESSATVIDHTKGCYPLCLNSEKRIEAFDHSLNDIYLHIEAILPLLLQYEAWCEELQSKLNQVYHLPRRA